MFELRILGESAQGLFTEAGGGLSVTSIPHLGMLPIYTFLQVERALHLHLRDNMVAMAWRPILPPNHVFLSLTASPLFKKPTNFGQDPIHNHTLNDKHSTV